MTAIAVLALAALVLLIGPTAAESVDLYEFEELTTTYGANAVAVRADGAEAVIAYSDRNNTTYLYTNYIFSTSGSSLNERIKWEGQSWYFRCAAFDPSSNQALIGASQGKLFRYNGGSVTQVNTGIPYDIVVIDFEPGSGLAYLGTSTSRLYQYSSGSVSLLSYITNSVTDLDVRSDGADVAVAMYNRIEIYNVSRSDWDRLDNPVDDDYEYYYVSSVEYSLNGNFLLAGWRDFRGNNAIFRWTPDNSKWVNVGKTANQVNRIHFENEGTFALLGMANNLQYLEGGNVAPVTDWYSLGATGVNDLDFNLRDYYFLVGTPEGVFKLKRKDNVKPWLDRRVSDVEFEEDDPSGGDNLIDLSVFVRDDRSFGKLRFEFDWQQDESLIKGTVDGQFLDFTQMVENWNGKMTFRLKVWDSGGDDVPGNVDDQFNRTNMFNVTIRQVNDPVSFISMGEKVVGKDDLVWFVSEGNLLNLTIVTMDVDNSVEMIQPPSFSFNRSLPSLRVDSKAMILTFEPRNKDVGSIYVEMTVTDRSGSADIIELVFHIKNVNNPPKLLGISDRMVLEDEWMNFTVTARDEDLEIGVPDVISFSTNRTDGVGGDDLPNFGFVVDPEDPTRIRVSFLPLNEDVGDIDVEFRVRDGFASPGTWQDTKTMRITVKNTNDAPNLIEVEGVSTIGLLEYPIVATEDKALTIDMEAQDDDLDSLIYYVDDSRFQLTQPGGGYEATLTFTATNNDVGQMYVTVSVWDIFNTFDELILNITVQNVNDPPMIMSFETMDASTVDQLDFTIYEDVLFTAPIVVVDIDSVDITYSDSGGIFTFFVSDDPLRAEASFIPTQNDVGEITTFLEVDDGDGDIDAIVIMLTVIGTNDPPGTPTITQLDVSSLVIPMKTTQVNDPDGDELNYTWDFGDHSPTVSGVDLVQVEHKYPRAGKYMVTLTVDDGNGGVSSSTFEVLVPETDERIADTEVEQGPVLLVVVFIVVFGAVAGFILYLYWKMPRNGEGNQN
jgi:hypothetical protein